MLLGLVGDENSLVGLGVLAGSAAIEYVFPPFPGDFVTVLGAILVTSHGWSLFAVLGAVMAGSILGSLVAFQVGVVLARRRARNPNPKPHPLLDAAIARFHRHGAAYVMVNRFLPGIRSLIFLAAGLAGMPRGRVLVFATLSALGWNLLLIALGAALGANLDALESFVRNYTMVVWVLLAAITLIYLVVRWRRARRRKLDTT